MFWFVSHVSAASRTAPVTETDKHGLDEARIACYIVVRNEGNAALKG